MLEMDAFHACPTASRAWKSTVASDLSTFTCGAAVQGMCANQNEIIRYGPAFLIQLLTVQKFPIPIFDIRVYVTQKLERNSKMAFADRVPLVTR
jgi:hypothetical protein